MKTTLLLPAALCLLAAPAYALTLREATPEDTQRFFAEQFRTFVFFDEARTISYSNPSFAPPAWVSRFGFLSGGDTFDTDLFSLADPLSASVWWDFGATGYYMKFVLVHWHKNGTGGERIYAVPEPISRITGPLEVQSATDLPIVSLAFYGYDPTRLPVPETNDSLALLVPILSLLAAAKRRTA